MNIKQLNDLFIDSITVNHKFYSRTWNYGEEILRYKNIQRECLPGELEDVNDMIRQLIEIP